MATQTITRDQAIRIITEHAKDGHGGTAADLLAAAGQAGDHAMVEALGLLNDDEVTEILRDYERILRSESSLGVQAARVQFGRIDDYYPNSEITEAERGKWADSAEAWREAVKEAVADIDGREEALNRASEIEREWGDDPSTQRVRRILEVRA